MASSTTWSSMEPLSLYIQICLKLYYSLNWRSQLFENVISSLLTPKRLAKTCAFSTISWSISSIFSWARKHYSNTASSSSGNFTFHTHFYSEFFNVSISKNSFDCFNIRDIVAWSIFTLNSFLHHWTMSFWVIVGLSCLFKQMLCRWRLVNVVFVIGENVKEKRTSRRKNDSHVLWITRVWIAVLLK